MLLAQFVIILCLPFLRNTKRTQERSVCSQPHVNLGRVKSKQIIIYANPHSRKQRKNSLKKVFLKNSFFSLSSLKTNSLLNFENFILDFENFIEFWKFYWISKMLIFKIKIFRATLSDRTLSVLMIQKQVMFPFIFWAKVVGHAKKYRVFGKLAQKIKEV